MWNDGIDAFIAFGQHRHSKEISEFMDIIGANHWRLEQGLAVLPNELRERLDPILRAAREAHVTQYDIINALMVAAEGRPVTRDAIMESNADVLDLRT